MNNKIGKVFHYIRKSKHLTMNEIAEFGISQSQISHFERGESSITIDKFLILLHNMSVTLDEFESIFSNFSLSEEDSFRKSLEEAYEARNASQLRSILKNWEEKHRLEPQKPHIRLNCIIIKTLLSSLTNFRMPKGEVEHMEEYLMTVEDWGRYELWAFSNCVQLFNDSTLNWFETAILQKTEFYKDITTNYQLVLRTTLNLIATWIQRDNYYLALKYINYLDGLNISIDFLYEKLMLRYNKGYYLYRIGDKSGLGMMRECNTFLSTLGYFSQEKLLRQDLGEYE